MCVCVPCERYPPCTKRVEVTLFTRDKGLKAEKGAQAPLLLLYKFTTPSSNPFFLSVLHKFIVSLSKKYKSCLFGHFFESHIFMSFWTFKIKFAFLLLMFYVNLIIRQAKKPGREEEKSFVPYSIILVFLS